MSDQQGTGIGPLLQDCVERNIRLRRATLEATAALRLEVAALTSANQFLSNMMRTALRILEEQTDDCEAAAISVLTKGLSQYELAPTGQKG